MPVPVPGWPGKHVSVPVGLLLSRKAEQADKLPLPYQPRKALARESMDFVAAPLPPRRIRVLGDGGDATKETRRQFPATVDVGSRRLSTGTRYTPPLPRTVLRRGGPPKKGALLGSP